MSKPIILVMTLFVTFTNLVLAEDKFPVTVSIGDYSRLGYKRPNIDIGAGVESQYRTCWFAVTGRFNPTDKIAYGKVTQSGVDGQLFWKPGRGIFLGGGVNLRNIRFHDFDESYWTYGSLLSGGWIKDNLRITLTSYLPRHDIRYNLHGISWGMIYDIKGRFRLGFQEGWYKLSRKDSTVKFNDPLTASFIIGYVF